MANSVVSLLAIVMLLGVCGIMEPPTSPDTAGGTGDGSVTGGETGDLTAGDTGTEDGTDTATDEGTDVGTDTGTSDTGTQVQNDTSGTGSTENNSQTDTDGSDAGTQEQADETLPPVTTLKNKEISYESGGWKINGTLYESQFATPTKTIMLVHELGKDRSSWPISFIERLHDEFPDAMVLAIDLRGHGKSTNLGTWANFDSAAFKDMKTDVISADKYVSANYPNAEQYYVIGASIGSTAAILASEQDKSIAKVVMISPGMAYRDVEIDRAVDRYAHDVLAVAANGDAYSVDAVREIDDLRATEYTKTMIYSGSAHGTDLFAATEGGTEPLGDTITDFLK